ncbi:MAG TPA: hypothetical protein VJT72_20555 [Pseudonocardiaceae bacterium]|nr:hypothetical protein [Pseudonocardiaceae bacterium]
MIILTIDGRTTPDPNTRPARSPRDPDLLKQNLSTRTDLRALGSNLAVDLSALGDHQRAHDLDEWIKSQDRSGP